MDIDEHYVWQWRVHHGVRKQRDAQPFPESVKIGLEFNAAVEREEKLDPCLLTNAVMLEICDFARTVTKSEMYFLFEILEYNFDLGLDANDDVQCYEFANRVHFRVRYLKEQGKTKRLRLEDAFQLPDPKYMKEIAASREPGRYYAKIKKAADISLLTDRSKKRLMPEKNESNEASSSTFVIKRKGRFSVKNSSNVYPFCKNLGVSFAVRDKNPKQKLDPSLVTTGLMMELLACCRALCGTQTQLVLDLVKQNFGLEMDKVQFHVQLIKLFERRHNSNNAKNVDVFRKQIFNFQINKRVIKSKKRKNSDTEDLEKFNFICERRDTLRPRGPGNSGSEETCPDTDASYMCPVDCETVSFSQEPFPDVVEDVQTKTRKQKVWKRRADRCKQILKSSKGNDLFARSREIGLDFNIASGCRQNLNLHLLTNWVLWEVFKFATTMTKSTNYFWLDILQNNFHLSFQNDPEQLQNLASYVTQKEMVLQSHPATQNPEFLNCLFELPEVYTMNEVRSDIQTVKETEQRDSSGSAVDQQMDMDPYPHCKNLGLNLWLPQERPSCQRLGLTALTTGAVLEISSFIRELCGSVQDMVCDVLKHNFDLDFQNGASETSQIIQQWFVTQKSLMKKQILSPEISRWLNTVVPLRGPGLTSPQPSRNILEHLGLDGVNLRRNANVSCYNLCKRVGLDLDVSSQSAAKQKLDLKMLTRGVLLEVHQYVEQNCKRYVPDLYEILEYNFDLSSQSHRKVEFAWCIASQVMAMVGKNGRKGDYLNTVFELPMEDCGSPQISCKEEPEDVFGEIYLNDEDEIKFIRKLKPVDIEVELE